ncbi:MAG TPA: hypothetical protein VIY73_07450 [Polyangiaceae bacterium]
MKPPPPPTRLALFSPEVSLVADPARLRAFLAASVAPELARLVTRDRKATARALWGTRMHLHVAELLARIARLATPAGRDALVEAARDVGRDHAGWADETPADLAVRVMTDAIVQHDVIRRADLRLQRRGVERPTYEVSAREAKRIPAAAGQATSRLRALAVALRDARGPGAGPARAGFAADAWVLEDEDTGDLHATVVRPGTRGEAPRADAFRFRVSEGRLATTAAHPQWLDAYAAAWGAALYDDPGFFAVRVPSVTIEPLHELGAAGLAAATDRGKLVPGVPRVRVVGCHLETGDGHRVEAHGPDAFARIAPHLRGGGHLLRATVRVDVGGEQGGVDCVLQPPHRVDVGWGGVAHASANGPRLAREVLVRLGLLSPRFFEDDIATMRPLLQPDARWVLLVGNDGYNSMCESGLLEYVKGRETTRVLLTEHFHFGGAAVAFPLFEPVTPLPGSDAPIDPHAPEHEKRLVYALRAATDDMVARTKYYVVPDDPALLAVSVRQTDMTMQRLSLGALLRKARKEMGLTRGERPKLPQGVLWVGEMAVEGGVVRFFYVVRATTEDKERRAIGKAITRAVGFGRPVVLVPKGRGLRRDFVEIELTVKEQVGADGWRGKVAEAVKALGIEDRVAPELVAPAGARLVVDMRRQRVILDGVPLVRLPENGYKLLRLLAESSSIADTVSTHETDKAISGARQTPGATRYTVFKLREWVERSFADAGRKVPADVRKHGVVRAVGRKGWRLTVKAAAVSSPTAAATTTRRGEHPTQSKD